MGTKASEWFTDPADLRRMCGDANSMANSEAAQDFAADMVIKANRHGLDMYLSLGQLEWLCKLADIDVPKRVKR
jgi:hypothetical protein